MLVRSCASCLQADPESRSPNREHSARRVSSRVLRLRPTAAAVSGGCVGAAGVFSRPICDASQARGQSPHRILHGPENERVRERWQVRFGVMGDFAQDGAFQGGGRAPGNNPQVISICNIRCGIRPPVPGILWAEMRMRTGGRAVGPFWGHGRLRPGRALAMGP